MCVTYKKLKMYVTAGLRQGVKTPELYENKERQGELCQELGWDNAIYLLINEDSKNRTEEQKEQTNLWFWENRLIAKL